MLSDMIEIRLTSQIAIALFLLNHVGSYCAVFQHCKADHLASDRVWAQLLYPTLLS